MPCEPFTPRVFLQKKLATISETTLCEVEMGKAGRQDGSEYHMLFFFLRKGVITLCKSTLEQKRISG